MIILSPIPSKFPLPGRSRGDHNFIPPPENVKNNAFFIIFRMSLSLTGGEFCLASAGSHSWGRKIEGSGV
jgi:hypothetical protein